MTEEIYAESMLRTITNTKRKLLSENPEITNSFAINPFDSKGYPFLHRNKENKREGEKEKEEQKRKKTKVQESEHKKKKERVVRNEEEFVIYGD